MVRREGGIAQIGVEVSLHVCSATLPEFTGLRVFPDLIATGFDDLEVKCMQIRINRTIGSDLEVHTDKHSPAVLERDSRTIDTLVAVTDVGRVTKVTELNDIRAVAIHDIESPSHSVKPRSLDIASTDKGVNLSRVRLTRPVAVTIPTHTIFVGGIGKAFENLEHLLTLSDFFGCVSA